MKHREFFISCDWGTSAFRLRLVDTAAFQVRAAIRSSKGNAAMDGEFRDSGNSDRLSFYLDYLNEQLHALEAESGRSLGGLPVLISGMASSTIGMRELPYKPLPFSLDGSDLDIQQVGTIGDGNAVYLISGVAAPDDVMRGEEVQAVGCCIPTGEEPQLLLHPGTHAKHMMIRGGKVIDFHTYMTGELFALLSEKSILAGSVRKPEGSQDDEAFRDGVLTGNNSNIVHSLFLVRTNALFGKRSPQANYRYLSGLLIGHELRAVPADFSGELHLAGDADLVREYRLALEILGIDSRVRLQLHDGDEITFRGQHAVYRHQLQS